MEKYQRLHQIGQGSFGAVFLVREVETGERLVMKLVNTANIAQSEQQKVKTNLLTRSVSSIAKSIRALEHRALTDQKDNTVTPLATLLTEQQADVLMIFYINTKYPR